MRTIHLLVILLALTARNATAAALRTTWQLRRQPLHTHLSGSGSSDEIVSLRRDCPRLSLEAKVQKINPHF
ncbi:hypothetical protein V8E53_013013 [Lactarius tabidus]